MNKVPVEIMLLRENARIPVYSTPGAAAADLFISEIEYQNDGRHVTVKLGIATDIEPGWCARIQPRSSFSHMSWVLTNSPAIIDSDYRGEWLLKFTALPIGIFPITGLRLITTSQDYSLPGNESQVHFRIDAGAPPRFEYRPFPYNVGDRCAQVIFEEGAQAFFIQKEELTETVRGNGGFGSTGQGEVQTR